VGELAGEWVEEVEGLTRVRFVASNGWWSTGGRPAGSAQAGWPRYGSAPVVLRSGRGRLVLGGLGGRAAPLEWHGTAAKAPEEGGVRAEHGAACRGRQWRARTARLLGGPVCRGGGGGSF
jgi:hypothetical protein